MAGGSLADHCRSQEPATLVKHGYSMTWSARPSTDGGIVRPSVFAVFRLTTSSKLPGLLDGEICGLSAFQDLVHVARRTAKQVVIVRCVLHQTSELDGLAVGVNARQAMPDCEVDDKTTVRVGVVRWRTRHQECISA